MADAYLRGSPMTTPVLGDDAIAVLKEEQHLRVPIVRGQRPTMAKHNGLTFAPVLVEDLDTVFGCDRAHVVAFLFLGFVSKRLKKSAGLRRSLSSSTDRVCRA